MFNLKIRVSDGIFFTRVVSCVLGRLWRSSPPNLLTGPYKTRIGAHRRRCADVRWLGGVERRLTLTLTLILTLTLTLTLTLAPNLTLKSLGGELLHQGYLFYGIRAYEAQML